MPPRQNCSLEQEKQRKRRMEKKMDRTVGNTDMARVGLVYADSSRQWHWFHSSGREDSWLRRE